MEPLSENDFGDLWQNWPAEEGRIALLPLATALNHLIESPEGRLLPLEILNPDRIFGLHETGDIWWINGERQCLGKTKVASWLQFLNDSKGYLPWRLALYREEGAANHPEELRWPRRKRFSPHLLQQAEQFPGCEQLGALVPELDHPKLRRLNGQRPLSAAQWEKLAVKHLQFLQAGGAGGGWQVLILKGLPVGLYLGTDVKAGRQANWEHCTLAPDCRTAGRQLPFANACGCAAPGQSFAGSDLSYALWADADLQGADFSGCNLLQADFSRADLRRASFRQSDLRGADFENADLREADFTGARLEGARFPGAVLK